MIPVVLADPLLDDAAYLADRLTAFDSNRNVPRRSPSLNESLSSERERLCLLMSLVSLYWISPNSDVYSDAFIAQLF